MEIHKIYKPITALPFRNNENYVEFEPCDALKPYIRCFGGTRRVTRQEKSDVVVKEIEKQLFDVTDMYQLIPKVEKVLLKYFNDRHINQAVLQAVSKIVVSTAHVARLCGMCCAKIG